MILPTPASSAGPRMHALEVLTVDSWGDGRGYLSIMGKKSHGLSRAHSLGQSTVVGYVPST